MLENKPEVVDPEILGETRSDGAAELELRVPEALAYFAGHFEEAPILPGVVQIHWAAGLARRCFGFDRPFRRMEAVKFKALVVPGQRLALSLRWHPASGKLEFSFRSATSEHSSGRLYFQSDV